MSCSDIGEPWGEPWTLKHSGYIRDPWPERSRLLMFRLVRLTGRQAGWCWCD